MIYTLWEALASSSPLEDDGAAEQFKESENALRLDLSLFPIGDPKVRRATGLSELAFDDG